ncbi:MAG: SDR family NAD(P)-dependent oxidoreductase [Planctomycetota bacterium]
MTQVEAAIREMAVDLVVANYNSPNQVVLSGRIPEIDRATELFSKRNLRGKKLPVAAAFHSPLVATASRAFRPELEDVEFAPSQLPVYANSTATEYPADPAAARDLLASQLARPVNFVTEIEQMYADGVRTFLEVGPGAVLTGLVNSILSGREYRAIALDSSNGRRGGIFDLAHALAQLSASGYSIRLDAWDPRTAEPAETGSNRLRIPICGANYVKPRTPLPPRAPMATLSTPETHLPQVSRMELLNGNAAVEPAVSAAPAVDRVATTFGNLTPTFSQAPSMTPFSQTDFGSGSPQSDDSLATIQNHLRTLQRMQEETARIHQQFLESQEAALRTFEELAKRQLDLTLRQHQPVANGRSPHLAPSDAVAPYVPSISDLIPAVPVSQGFSNGAIVEHVAQPVAVTVAPVIAAVPAPVAPAPIVTPVTSSPLTAIVLAVVSEKTGYPTEMLNLGMSLDHDLGIDSIKRVEILSALQERVPNLPAFKPEELGSLHTLNDVVALADARTGAQPATTTVPLVPPVSIPTPPAVAIATAPSALTATVLAVVSEKTGYPTEMLNLGMSLDHDLGIDSIKRVEILSALQERVTDLPAFKPEELGSLHTLQDVVTLAEARTGGPATIAAPPVSAIAEPMAQSPAVATISPSGLTNTVLAVVSEKTGYPVEMLNLEMSLDHDLGIDSIKRVEILSALQERVPNLPAFKPEELGSLHTLNDVVMLADARTGQSMPIAAPPVMQTLPPVPLAVVAPLVIQIASQPKHEGVASNLTATVLAVVSEKTGYPTEMLNLEMSLDHDLGIDSIKRVEILSALQERVPNLPAFLPEELGELHTLKDVVTLAEARTGRSQKSVAVPTIPAPVAAPVVEPVRSHNVTPSRRQTIPGESCNQPATLVRSVVRAEALPPLSSAVELPIQRGSEIWVTEDGLELSLRIAAELSARGFKPRVVNLDEPSASAIPDRFAGLIIVSPAEGTTDRQLWRAIEWLQKAGPALRRTAAGSTAVFATISRLDGQFGFGSRRTITDPISGGLAGLVKSAAREWPELTCKAFDLATDWPSAGDAAQQIVNELFRQGPVEIGLSPGGRSTPKVVEESLSSMITSPVAIKPGELIVVSGGARGVTAEAALAVAHQWKSRLVILGRSPLPPEEPEWLRKLTTETEIKQGLIASLPRGTLPKVIESNYRQILASREVTTTLTRLREAGVPVSYHAVDIRDHATVRPLLLQLQGEFGPIRGIIHGAGVLADQRIEDKTRDQFDRVYQTKVSGLRNLLGAVRPDMLEFLCLFSSYTARYGRVGQCDYAVANEVLNKLACQFAVDHPRTHVVSFNWGPWDGGMVTGGLKKLFAAEQVGLIPLTDGASLVVQELSQSTSRPVEVLVLGKNEDLLAAETRPAVRPVPAVNPAPVEPVPSPMPIAASPATMTVPRQPEPVSVPAAPMASAPRNSSNILLAGSSAAPAGATVSPARQSVHLQGSSNILLAGEPVPPVRVMSPPPVRQQGSSNVLLAGSLPAPQQPQPVPVPNPSGSWVFAEIGQTGANEANELKVAFERTIDLKQYPFLESHVIGGRAVLPVAVVMEWLAHGAIHHNPGLDLEGIDDFRVFHGVRMDRVGSITLRVMVGKTVRVGGRFTVRTQLVSQSGGRDVVHAGGTVTLTSQYTAAAEPRLKVTLRGYSLDMATAYATKLFHGSHLQGIAAVEACSQDGIIVDSRTSPAPWAWMREPLRSAWIADPLSIDAALQAVILWAQEIKGLPCLPCSIGAYRQYRKVFPHTGVKIVVQVTHASEHSIRADVEFLDLSGMVVATMTGCESVADASLASAFRNNRLAPEGG